MLLENRMNHAGFGLLSESIQRREHRHIGLPGAVLLDALTFGDPDCVRANRVNKRADQSAFADSGLTGDEENTSASFKHPFIAGPHPIELSFATNHNLL